MSSLSDIGVSVENATGNVQPLLHEIRHALSRLANDGEGSVIDLRGIPLAPGEETLIEDTLGVGEVFAELNALGITKIQETAFAGVWMVTHRNLEDEIVARFVEVCRIPEILCAQPDDVRHSADSLAQTLDVATQVNGNDDTGSEIAITG
jgi:hydrogenase-1 operon protein HyaF